MTDISRQEEVFATYGSTAPDLEGFRMTVCFQDEFGDIRGYVSNDGTEFAYVDGESYGLLSVEEYAHLVAQSQRK